MFRPARRTLAAVILGLTVSGQAAIAQGVAAQGDPEAGLALARRWCVNCHVVEPGQRSGAASGVPTFPGIAAMPSTTALSLHAFLRTPHVRMPDLQLSNREIDDVTAYILSLRPRR